jgi:hypothetical protein
MPRVSSLLLGSVSALATLGLVIGGCATAAGPSSTSPVEPAESPHAEGQILLGEAHTSTGSTSAPVVSVSFVPDTSAVKACGVEVMGSCKVTRAPKCATKCGVGETCAWSDSCAPTCKKACTKACDMGEECYFPSEGAAAQCRKTETFDSGAVAFAGTTQPITLYPPYAFESTGKGAPFLAGADLTVQGSGAAMGEAGFSAWQMSAKATTFLQTGLEKTTTDVVFGSAALPVKWTPGSDTIQISLSGAGGAVVCQADDAKGAFDVPRDVVNEALGTSSTLSIAVSRQRKEVKKGIATQGTLTTAKLQPEGWVKVTTFSTETKSFQGCTGGQAMCGGKCTDTSSDDLNCGKCGNACTGGTTCSSGTCTSGGGATCQTCSTSAQSGSCKTAVTQCNNSSACSGLISCIQGCSSNSTCIDNCATYSTYSSGITLYNNLINCICGACASECASQCQ